VSQSVPARLTCGLKMLCVALDTESGNEIKSLINYIQCC
jgi:hypothetical protein